MFYELEKDKKIHQYFHHLNSSQAMCINFFFPLFKEKKLEIILQALGLYNEKVDYETVNFEFDEKSIEKKYGETSTSFDFYFETKRGKEIYFEIKYTENKFGKTEKDERHLNKYKNIYEKEADKVIISKYNNDDCFFENYQIMRNLIHVSDKDNNKYVVFIIPEDNKLIYKQAKEAKDFVKDKYKNNVKVLSWDNLYNIIKEQNFTGNLKKHFSEFKKKYKLKN